MIGTSKYKKKAEILVRSCESIVVTSFEDIAQYSQLVADLEHKRQIDVWDRMVLVASVGTAVIELENRMRDRDFQSFYSIIAKMLGKLDSHGPELLSHLLMFIHAQEERGHPRVNSVGAWVLSNIKGAAPTVEELTPAAYIGDYLKRSLASWWSTL
ncbi:hypothetical protein [Poriferisphaera sp. WC338]|uniref:hypothetical protein n=1 Tax=Poriferisphaera sp. WC338 TaxID=3425129 RepID=UPI003D8175E0